MIEKTLYKETAITNNYSYVVIKHGMINIEYCLD